MYNVPSNTGVEFPLEAIFKLAKHPNIIGYKDSGGNVSNPIVYERESLIRVWMYDKIDWKHLLCLLTEEFYYKMSTVFSCLLLIYLIHVTDTHFPVTDTHFHATDMHYHMMTPHRHTLSYDYITDTHFYRMTS